MALTPDEVRSLVAELAEAEESSHHGHPDFRVANQIFATLSANLEWSALRLALDDAEGVARSSPEAYELTGGRGGVGWLKVRLSTATADDYRPLLKAAWRLRRDRLS